MKHTPYTHIHPTLVWSLRTRTRLLGTVNVAVALKGKSCGWGSCERPRRTFFGYLRRPKNDTGLHFVEFTIQRDGMRDQQVFRLGDKLPAMVRHLAGEAITALCGKVDVPTRDFTKYPKCGTCVEIWESMQE